MSLKLQESLIEIEIGTNEFNLVLLPSSAPPRTQLGAELVIFPINPVTCPPSHPTRKVVSSQNTVYSSKTTCYKLISKLRQTFKHLLILISTLCAHLLTFLVVQTSASNLTSKLQLYTLTLTASAIFNY